MKQTTRGAAIGSVIGGFVFIPLTIPILSTLMWNVKTDSIENPLIVDTLFFLIADIIGVATIVVGVIIGRLIGEYIERNSTSLVSLKNATISIVLGSIALFGIIGLDIGAWFSVVTLIGLGNTSTASDLWIFSGTVMIVGVIAGAVIGVLIAVIRFVINKLYAFSKPTQ